MSSEYKFVETDVDTIKREMTSDYESEVGEALLPASPEAIMLNWMASIIVYERALINRAGNRNIPSRSDGKDLDALGELFYEKERPASKAAVSTERFHISEIQNKIIVIPRGTRVTDMSSSLFWETTEDALIPVGETYVDVPIQCQTVGIEANGFEIGQLCVLVDVFEYYLSCENLTASDGGTDEATDEEYYELMRNSQDGYSCAGPTGGYIYFAKQVSTEIADVAVITPSAGNVAIYVLMNDGTIADETIKNLVIEACNKKNNRPATDLVSAADAEYVTYDLEFKYYVPTDTSLSAEQIESAVNEAVEKYIAWQCGKLGRDITPDKLREYLIGTGIKRIELSTPVFTRLYNGEEEGLEIHIPQVAKIGTINISLGGYENE